MVLKKIMGVYNSLLVTEILRMTPNKENVAASRVNKNSRGFMAVSLRLQMLQFFLKDLRQPVIQVLSQFQFFLKHRGTEYTK